MIRVGPAGWSYDNWKGIVYPPDAGQRFDQLAYISQFFDTIEINSSYYRPPAPHVSKSWAVNALEIKSELEGRKVPGPASLLGEYPHAKESIEPR